MSLAVEKYGNRYLGDREVKLRVTPYRTTFGRQRWRAQVLVERPVRLRPSEREFSDVRWSGSLDTSYWPFFKSSSRDEAIRRARRWVEEARWESRRVDLELAHGETVAAVEPAEEVADAVALTASDAFVAGLIDVGNLEVAVAHELQDAAQ